MKKQIYILAISTALLSGTNILAEAQTFNFTLKNKSPRPIQIEITQDEKPLINLTRVGVRDIFVRNINIKNHTKLYIYHCPDDTWCKKPGMKPVKMAYTFSRNKPIHISFDGKKLRPQRKRLKNVGSGDIVSIPK